MAYYNYSTFLALMQEKLQKKIPACRQAGRLLRNFLKTTARFAARTNSVATHPQTAFVPAAPLTLFS